MTKITPDHLARQAIVYIRQSTADQVANNLESKRRQYNLPERARQLGWSDVAVIDDDLGRSGGGVARPGFEKLLAAICGGGVGAVVSVEASRLARNGRDWHTLLEFCGLVGTLIVDEDSVYDPRHPNDRLLLGMKGTMSEMELSVLRQRSLQALKQKARRGELYLTVAVGYVKVAHNRIDKDPDQRVQEAITLVFAKFAQMQSIRQVHLWLRQENIVLPVAAYRDQDRQVAWKLPVYRTIHHVLTNPIYAGAYVFGRTGSRVMIENGRKRVTRGHRKEQEEWEVLIHDHHAGYVSWAEYEKNQKLIADNANGKTFMSRGAIRKGEALLAGLFRCGHCGRKLHVAYSGVNGNTGRYHCRGSQMNHGGSACISFGGMRVDRAVGADVIARVQPLGVEAALAAMETCGQENEEIRRQVDLAFEQACYEATRARRQYDAVDPDNRLVASELERRWNESLLTVRTLEDQRDALVATPMSSLSEGQRESLLSLGADLERTWNSPGATPATRKRIIRTLINEIVVRVSEQTLELVIHWHGGDHTELKVKKNRAGQHRWGTTGDVVDLVRALARQMPDKAIASVLNRAGKATGKGNSWTHSRVCSLRNKQTIAVYQEGERAARGEVTLAEAAITLNISPSTVRRLIEDGTLTAQQFCKGAPWIIRSNDLDRPEVQQTAQSRRLRLPSSADPKQKELNL